MRRCSVFVPRSASQASNGPGHGAGRVEDELQPRGEVVVVHDGDPPTMSLWPLRYFVVECHTMSAP
jgi:hypothetical protein